MDWKMLWASVFFILVALCPNPATFQATNDGFVYLTNGKAMENIIASISTSIVAKFNESVNPDVIENELKRVTYKVAKVNESDLQDQFVNGVEKLFKSKTKVLESIRQSAEDAEMNHDYSKQFEDGMAYFNMRDIGDKYNINESVAIVNTFTENVKVNLTHSFVQVPTNVYAYRSNVLHQVDWAKHIDKSFTQNFHESNKTLLWQFYGDSSTGIFRIYPGSIITLKDGKTDLYDCRRRIWYIQAAASAKDIVILLDMSGSMIGNNIGIAKIAISSIIDTFQENDFFNIILINKEVKYTVPCIKYLIQATKENKEMMKRVVQNISDPSSIVDVNIGMDEAFKILNAGPSYNRTSAGCNQAIMFISDGIEGSYAGKESLERNNKDKRVRVFSYLVGRVKNPDKKALVEMSCNNGGYFYRIETLANIWDTVLDYLRVMSRPITEKYETDKKLVKPIYSPSYLDSAGFGMVMSIAISVFKKRMDAGTKKPVYKEYLGVAGTDIALKNLQDQIELSKMGVFSRGFVINNNGFILIHPKFREQTGYLPAPPNILMDELEYSKEEGESTKLKVAMLDPEATTSTAFITHVLYNSNSKVHESKTAYTYRKIPDTDLVAAVAIAEEDKKYLTIDPSTREFEDLIKLGIESLHVPIDTFDYTTYNMTKTNTTFVTISPWNYCHNPDRDVKKPKGIKTYQTAEELYEFLKKIDIKDIYKYCQKELIDRLLILAAVSSEGSSLAWDEEVLVNMTDSIRSVFVATSSGFQKYQSFHNGSKASSPFPRDVLRTQLFEMPSALPDVKYLVNGPVHSEKETLTNEPVLVAIKKPYRVDGVIAAVMGTQLSSEYLNNLIIKSSTFASNSFTTHKYCENNNTAVCALIDDHGYIIASNQQNKYTGQFIGERLGGIIPALESELGYKKLVLDDTQAECPMSDEPSAANFLLTPAKILIAFISSFVKSTYWITVQLGIFLISLFQHGSSVNGQEPKTIRVSCTKEMPFYRTDLSKIEVGKSYHGKYDCPACKNKRFIMRKLPEMNLIYLIAETPEGCGCFTSRVSLKHLKKESTIDWCKPPKQNFRKAPSTCFNETKAKSEEKQACGSGVMTKPVFMMVLSIALTLIYFIFS